MRAKLISRKENHTYIVEMDHELAHLLFVQPNGFPEELIIRAPIQFAEEHAVQIANLKSLYKYLKEVM